MTVLDSILCDNNVSWPLRGARDGYYSMDDTESKEYNVPQNKLSVIAAAGAVRMLTNVMVQQRWDPRCFRRSGHGPRLRAELIGQNEHDFVTR